MRSRAAAAARSGRLCRLFSGARDVPDRRPRRPDRRFRGAGASRIGLPLRRPAKIFELARQPAFRQGPHALRLGRGARRGGAPARGEGDCRRGLYGCDCAAPRRLSDRGGAARHRPLRSPACRIVAPVARAGIVLRRRRSRAARRHAGDRARTAAAATRAQFALRMAADGRGSRFDDPQRRAHGVRTNPVRGAPARRRAVGERAGGKAARHARRAGRSVAPPDGENCADPDRKLRSEYRNAFSLRFDPRPVRRIRRTGSPAGARAVRDGPEPPPRSLARVQRENLFRLLLHHPGLIEEGVEEFAALALPEPELDRLRRAILEAVAARPGLDARALRQHLLQNGFAATVEALLLPSVDAGFLVRCADPLSARKEWTHVIGILTAGDRSGFTEASKELESEFSPRSWERFVAARERMLAEQRARDDDSSTPAGPV